MTDGFPSTVINITPKRKKKISKSKLDKIIKRGRITRHRIKSLSKKFEKYK